MYNIIYVSKNTETTNIFKRLGVETRGHANVW